MSQYQDQFPAATDEACKCVCHADGNGRSTHGACCKGHPETVYDDDGNLTGIEYANERAAAGNAHMVICRNAGTGHNRGTTMIVCERTCRDQELLTTVRDDHRLQMRLGCTCLVMPPAGALHVAQCPMFKAQVAAGQVYGYPTAMPDPGPTSSDPDGTSFGYPNGMLAALGENLPDLPDPPATEKPELNPEYEKLLDPEHSLPPIPDKPETVNHPAHYGGDTTYEVIKVLEAWGLDADAYLFNVVKYIGRPAKGDYLEDLKKARFYLNRKIARMEAASELPQS